MDGASHTRHNHGLSQDAQGHWLELLSPTQVLTGESEKQIATAKKKCHDNRKAQRQRRKFRQQKEKKERQDEEDSIMDQDANDTIPQTNTGKNW